MITEIVNKDTSGYQYQMQYQSVAYFGRKSFPSSTYKRKKINGTIHPSTYDWVVGLMALILVVRSLCAEERYYKKTKCSFSYIIEGYRGAFWVCCWWVRGKDWAFMGRTHCIFISQQKNFFKQVNRYTERCLRLERLLVRHKLVIFPSIVKYSD